MIISVIAKTILFYIFWFKICEVLLSCRPIKCLSHQVSIPGLTVNDQGVTWFSTSISHKFAIKLNRISSAKDLSEFEK